MPERLPPLAGVIARLGLAAKRGLGQHYLLDANLTAKIARAAAEVTRGTTIEVGSGPGGLTRALLAAGAAVLAVELDRRCVPALIELSEAWPGRLNVIEGDALTLDLPRAAAARGLAEPYRIVANLPYNIATALLLGWLDQVERYESLTLMFQKEVADRLAAKPHSKAYGRLSVMTQWRCTVTRLFELPPGAFVPPPKVISTVLRLVPRPTPLALADRALLERVVGAAFGQRRKMLRSSLRTLGCAGAAILELAGVPPTARAEELTIEQFCALARALETLEP